MRIMPLLLASLALAACDNAPAAPPSLREITAARALWSAHHLTRYAYVYEELGFLNTLEGRRIRLVVLNDSVTSAQDLATDSVLSVTAALPTLDKLFDAAVAAQAAGTLTAIIFDSTFSFPARMDFAGPPDASGSVLASDLQLLP